MARLVTLVGPGGCGKTRLAVRVALTVADRFPDGLVWVDLAPLAEGSRVGPALARSLGVQPMPGMSHADAAVSYLAARSALVLLDNCEHVLGDAARVAQALVYDCPGVTLLATSREPLGVQGEIAWRVPSLSVPSPGADPRSADAVQLFVERARAARQDLDLSDGDALEAVVDICGALDGIPLALELAAARLRHLSIGQLAAGLHDRFSLLSRGPRTSLPRYQTLRGSVEWSHDLLSDAEQMVFRRLGVFVGGCRLDASVEVCGEPGLSEASVIDLVASLVDKSLVHLDDREGEVRYSLLETMRAYALERLVDAGESDDIRSRHRDLYLRMAEESLARPGPDSLARLDPEAANLEAAAAWASDTDPTVALRLCEGLLFWWATRARFDQGEQAIRRGLEADTGSPSALRARAQWAQALLLMYRGEAQAATKAAAAAVATAEEVGDDVTASRALTVLGMLQVFTDPARGRATLETSLSRAVACGDQVSQELAGMPLAYSYNHQDDHVASRRAWAELVPTRLRGGDREPPTTDLAAWYWIATAWADYVAGDHRAAQHDASLAISAARTVGSVVTETAATAFLAFSRIDAGAAAEATELIAGFHERATLGGGGFAIPWLEVAAAEALAAVGRLEDAGLLLDQLTAQGTGGIRHAQMWALVDRAEVCRLLGDLEQAASLAESVLEQAAEIDNGWFELRGRVLLGLVAGIGEEWTQAQQLLHSALALTAADAHRREAPRLIESFSRLAAGVQRPTEAARLLGAARAARTRRRSVGWPAQCAEGEALEQQLTRALGTERFATAVAEGANLSTEAALAYLRRARGRRGRPRSGWDSLTPTELEVMRHATAGLTNLQIGERMFIAPGTVKVHLSRIYAKVGVSNRSALTAEAVRRGLAGRADTPS